ncbi:unnamed protein product [Leptidea sinapis]|uniref:Partial AB-hydrolase lipase domain-containing protein n=1 Tax=Leptidea sinapis TaxID=189913 RepID=A0A5E4PLU0_9NEOP|nr:unnamed protein product [Leptidea sinapis]
MMFLLLLSVCITLAAAGRSPQADSIEKLIKNNFFGRVSDNIAQDAILDVPDLIRKYNYPVEEHSVITRDGYIIGLHRIPHGRDSNTTPGNKPAVLVMHGLLGSSADWVLMGPETALAYILAEEGFDVWLGNARGNFYSRRHLLLNPDEDNNSFWQFSLDEIGNIDLPAVVDYILRRTGRSGLHYIGMSQGTTVFFIMGSLRPEYSEKILSMHALAPVAYTTQGRNALVDALAPVAANIVFAHFSQNVASKRFRRYDYGLVLNVLKYGSAIPPNYNLSNIKNPVFLHFSEGDTRVAAVDVDRLYDELGGPKEKILVSQKTFSHVDFMWGTNARYYVFDRVIRDIRKIENA